MMNLKKKHKKLMSKKFLSMLIGGTLTMMVVSILLMSDSIIAGLFIGSNAVAGITLVTPIYSLAAFFGSVFALGVPIVYDTEMGKFNKKKADQSFGFGLLMAITIGVGLFILITILGDIYLRSNNPLVDVLEQGRGYLKWMRFTILVMPLQMVLAALVYSDGDETLSTLANVIQGAGNIVLSIILSQRFGISGIALSSFLFNIVSLLILAIHFFKKSNSLKINLYFSRKLLKDVGRLSIIDSSSYLFLSFLTFALNAFVSVRFGTEFLIIVSVISLVREFQLIFDGIGEAITPILSVYIGEESISGVKSIYSLANKTAIIEGIVVTIILFICAPLIPKMLDITDATLLKASITCIRVLSLGSTFVCLHLIFLLMWHLNQLFYYYL